MKKVIHKLTLAAAISCFLLTNHAKAQCSAVGNGTSNGVFCLHTDTVSDLLFTGGIFSTSGTYTLNNCGAWNNTNFASMGMSGAIGTSDTVLCFALYHGNMYVGGNFLTAGGITVNHIAMWDGSMWHAVGNGFDVSVHSLAVYNDSLYAGGDFSNSGTTPTKHLAKWNGTQWNQVNGGTNDDVDAMYVWNNALYISGDFTQAGTTSANHICKWDDVAFTALGSGMTSSMSGMTPMVHSLCAYNGSLYAGGMYDQAGGASMNNMAKWDGSTWSSIGNVGTSMGSDVVSSLCVYGGQLFVGGGFATCGTLSANNIGIWNGASWSTLGTGMNSNVQAMDIYHNTLYIGGIFTIAAGTSANHIASYSSPAGIQPFGIQNSESTINVYPNPANTIMNVELGIMNGIQNTTLIITDMLGNTVKQLIIHHSSLIIDISDLAEGVYNFQISTSSNSLINKRVVIAH
ncbi:MAG: T9SS type A sorting domain-containing protein [Bacteroidia bacterium]